MSQDAFWYVRVHEGWNAQRAAQPLPRPWSRNSMKMRQACGKYFRAWRPPIRLYTVKRSNVTESMNRKRGVSVGGKRNVPHGVCGRERESATWPQTLNLLYISVIIFAHMKVHMNIISDCMCVLPHIFLFEFSICNCIVIVTCTCVRVCGRLLCGDMRLLLFCILFFMV